MTPRTPYHVRKALEISFRRWLSGFAPSNAFVAYLREQDRARYHTHFAAQFSDGMSWENYGNVWQADHIVPLSAFDLSRAESIALAWSLDNLRPLTIAHNKARGASVADAYCALLTRQPVNPTEHKALLEMIEPEFRSAYPRLSLIAA